jgi:ribonuclease HI
LSKGKWYVVWEGKQPGVYRTWAECQAQVHGHSGARFKSFPSQSEALAAYEGVATESRGDVLTPSLAVDAACSGNPGILEYRAVWVHNGEQVFHKGPFECGTNNIGEFLGLVDGLTLLQSTGNACPLYTDSNTALSWLSKRRVNTTLERNASTSALFRAIEQAEQWLRDNEIKNRVLKWDTQNWGEIPADFGRK